MARPGRPLKCDPKIDDLRNEIQKGNYDIAKTTLNEFGIDATDRDGRTALINAVIENQTDFIYWLVENRANVNIQDRIGYSVLHYTAQNIHVELTKYLLDNGTDPNLQDIHGNTALWTAIFNAKLSADKQGVVNLLLEFGANPDLINKHGKTPRNMYQRLHNEDIPEII